MLHRSTHLTLIALTLLACTKEAQSTYPERRAGRGEPCAVLNDCKEPLLCLAGSCLDAKPAVAATNKQCFVSDCLTDADCCPPLAGFLAERCQSLEQRCASGDGFACDEQRSLCTCTESCQDYQCKLASFQGLCAVDADCGPGNLCHEQRCVECVADASCGEGRVCIAMQCQLACTHDGHCGAFERCSEDGRCQARGCLNDRECISLLRRRDAVCQEDECVVPCGNDAVCASFAALSSCSKGVCRDLGCEQDADCEARSGAPDRKIALCLDADEVRGLLQTSGGAF